MPDTSRLGWAIAGTGTIARRFAEDMRLSASGRIVAVASAVPERAAKLAAAIGPGVAHGDLDATIARADVDAVYVAGRNERHCEHALACLAGGKPVLVEKPFASSMLEAVRIAEAARGSGLLTMEAMWMRFIPAMRELSMRVRRGDLGRLRQIEATLAFHNPQPIADVLPDLGVYPISLAVQLLGHPASVAATAAGDGLQSALLLAYPQAMAMLGCGFVAEGANSATLTGTAGVLRTNAPLFAPTLLSFRRTGAASPARPEGALAPASRLSRRDAGRSLLGQLRASRMPILYRGNGLHYQADHFAECLRKGLRESPIMPLAESIEVIRIVEAAERQLRDQFAKDGAAKVETGR